MQIISRMQRKIIMRFTIGKTLNSLFCIVTMLVASNVAFASSWMECRVSAKVIEHVTENLYSIRVYKATVTDGFAEVGDQCMAGNIGKTFEVKLDKNVQPGEMNTFKYLFSNNNTPDGSSRNLVSWKVWN